jgi:hypothetical protein
MKLKTNARRKKATKEIVLLAAETTYLAGDKEFCEIVKIAWEFIKPENRTALLNHLKAVKPRRS